MHLINDGITLVETDGGMEAVIEWALSTPSSVDRELLTLRCSLDGNPIDGSLCKALFITR